MKKPNYEELIKFTSEENIKINEPLSNFTYTKTGGNAEYLITPQTYKEVENIYKYGIEHKIPVTIIGNGSNVLVKDGGLRGIVLILTKMNEIKREENLIIVQSGAAIIDTSKYALENSLTGLEFACGIPGSVGGALYMNAGAYGGEMSDVIIEALVIDQEGRLRTIQKEQMELEYRKSIFSKQHFVILEVKLKLEPGKYEEIKNRMVDLTEMRSSKQPLEYPSCGSVFKRPPGYFAGKLIRESGLQGKQIGGAQVSKKHAGFIVNVDRATSRDYLELIEYIKNKVKSQFGIELETEVKIIGDECKKRK